MKPTIMLLATGGTIASLPSENGLVPALRAQQVLSLMPRLSDDIHILAEDVFSLDSSNIQPEEWRKLAQAVKKAAEKADGIVITHGTDTMAYTAAALSFMLQGLGKPVVLTGSQLPLTHPLSDAATNLSEAFATAAQAAPGVYVVFHHKVILGTRAVKMRTVGFDAFDSVNAPPVGFFDADGLHLTDLPRLPQPTLGQAPMDAIDSRVFLLKLMPGTSPTLFTYLKNGGYKGLVLEAFGMGGLHYIRRNLLDGLKKLSNAGLITFVTTQCLYEKADFSRYEVGRHVLSEGIYGAHDMTTEAALGKLMWVLGDREARQPLINVSLAHEMSLNPSLGSPA